MDDEQVSRSELQEHFEIIQECQRRRGWIVNAYAQVEFLLGDLPMRLYGLPSYASAARPVVMGIDSRLKVLEELLDVPGPLRAFEAELRALLAPVKRLEQLRHFLIHGMAEYHFTPSGTSAMKFRRYIPPKKGGVAELQQLMLTADDLEQLRSRWVSFSQDFLAIVSRIYLDLDLEQHGPETIIVVWDHKV